MAKFLNGVYPTDSGMLCVWNPDSFAAIVDQDSWETELSDDQDILRHIKAGSLVPVGIHEGLDGGFGVHLRVGDKEQEAELTEREAKYVLAKSEPYRFKSKGRLCVSGLEYVEGKPDREIACLPIPAGDYAVRVFLIAWDEEPGMKDGKGRPKEDSLPDFVVLANPTKGPVRFRQKLYAMDPPG